MFEEVGTDNIRLWAQNSFDFCESKANLEDYDVLSKSYIVESTKKD